MTPNYDTWTIELVHEKNGMLIYRILTDIGRNILSSVVAVQNLDTPEFRAFVLKCTIDGHECGSMVGPSEVK